MDYSEPLELIRIGRVVKLKDVNIYGIITSITINENFKTSSFDVIHKELSNANKESYKKSYSLVKEISAIYSGNSAYFWYYMYILSIDLVFKLHLQSKLGQNILWNDIFNHLKNVIDLNPLND